MIILEYINYMQTLKVKIYTLLSNYDYNNDDTLIFDKDDDE